MDTEKSLRDINTVQACNVIQSSLTTCPYLEYTRRILYGGVHVQEKHREREAVIQVKQEVEI